MNGLKRESRARSEPCDACRTSGQPGLLVLVLGTGLTQAWFQLGGSGLLGEHLPVVRWGAVALLLPFAFLGVWKGGAWRGVSLSLLGVLGLLDVEALLRGTLSIALLVRLAGEGFLLIQLAGWRRYPSNIRLRREIPRAPGASMTPEAGRGGAGVAVAVPRNSRAWRACLVAGALAVLGLAAAELCFTRGRSHPLPPSTVSERVSQVASGARPVDWQGLRIWAPPEFQVSEEEDRLKLDRAGGSRLSIRNVPEDEAQRQDRALLIDSVARLYATFEMRPLATRIAGRPAPAMVVTALDEGGRAVIVVVALFRTSTGAYLLSAEMPHGSGEESIDAILAILASIEGQ